MDLFALGGMVLTYILTEVLKKNPKFKEQAPVVVSILSVIIGAFQSALSAVVANAQGVDSTAVVAQSGGFVSDIGQYALNNLLGGIGLHVGVRKWAVDWFWGTVIKKFF